MQDIEQLVFIDDVYNIYSNKLLTIEKSSNEILEGGVPVEIRIALNEKPNDTVNINISTGNVVESNETQLSFNANNWSTYQSIQLSVQDDEIFSEISDQSINISFSSSDAQFDNIPNQEITFSIKDDDQQETPEINNSISGNVWNDINKNKLQDR